MADIRPSIVMEDSKGNKYFFYYKDYSIYYREVSDTGDIKDTILISQVNTDFTAVIDSDDTLYLTCNSRYKGVLLFIYTNYGWKFEPVVNLHNSSSIYIMDMVVQNGSVHIFFSKKLPIANMYNVYHIHKDMDEQVPYIEYSWRKNSLSEIYSQNIESSFSILPSKGGIIHYASVWYDGTHHYINYYCFDESIKSWIHKSLNISYKNPVSIKLLHHNKKINLVCFSNEGDGSNVHLFINKSSGSSETDFKEIGNARIETGNTVPLFYSDDKALQLAWIKDHVYHQYTLDDSSGKWKKAIDLPITAEINLQYIKYVRNAGSVSISKGYFLIEKDYNILRPVAHNPRIASEDKQKEKQQPAAVPETSDYLKQLLDVIKDLSENVRSLNNRIEDLENRNDSLKEPEERTKELVHQSQKAAADGSFPGVKLKKSNFREKFMKAEKAPNYESLRVNQENINTYVGKPKSSSEAAVNPPEHKADADSQSNGKQAFVPPASFGQQSGRSEKLEETETSSKNNNVLKKIGEFFK